MKTKLLSIAALSAVIGLASPQSASAGAYDGFAIGGTVGFEKMNVDIDTKEGATPNGFKKSHNVRSYPLGLFIDYSKTLESGLYLGIQLGGGYSLGSQENTFFSREGTELKYELTPQAFAQLTPKVGWNFESFVAYFLVEFSAQKVEHKFVRTVNGTQNLSHKESDAFLSIAPGVAFEKSINENWYGGLNYKYKFINSVAVKYSQNITDKLDIKTSSHQVNLIVGYRF